VQGFSFCPAVYQLLTIVYGCLSAVNAIYTTTTPKPFTGLYRGFSVDFPYFSAYNTAAAQAAYTTAAPDAVKLSTAAYYNKVYKGAGLRPLL
jgi:hypothetical protein